MPDDRDYLVQTKEHVREMRDIVDRHAANMDRVLNRLAENLQQTNNQNHMHHTEVAGQLKDIQGVVEFLKKYQFWLILAAMCFLAILAGVEKIPEGLLRAF